MPAPFSPNRVGASFTSVSSLSPAPFLASSTSSTVSPKAAMDSVAARVQSSGLLRRESSETNDDLDHARRPILASQHQPEGDSFHEISLDRRPEDQHGYIAAGSIEIHELAEKRRGLLRVRGTEWVYLIANRVYFSTAYSVLYVVMILLNLIMLVWLVINSTGETSSAFVIFEGLVTLVLGIEVAARMLTQGCKYWKRWSNWFEFTVLLLCIGTTITAHTTNYVSMSEEVDELLSAILMAARYVLQGLRLLALLQHRKRLAALNPSGVDFASTNRRTSSLGIIDFDNIDEHEIDPLHDPDLIMRDALDFDALVASAGRGSRGQYHHHHNPTPPSSIELSMVDHH